MLLDRDLRGAPLRRSEVMLWAVLNPADGFTASEVTPASVAVQVHSEDLTTDFGTQPAPFSPEVSAALTARLGTDVRAWVAQLPANTYGGASRVAVTSIVTVGSTAYPSTEVVAVVGL